MQEPGHNSEMTAPVERVIVLPKANSSYPLKGDFERMARRRHQNPKPVRRGEWWTLRVWKDTFTEGEIIELASTSDWLRPLWAFAKFRKLQTSTYGR